MDGTLEVCRVSTSFQVSVTRVGLRPLNHPSTVMPQLPVSGTKYFGCRQLNHESRDGMQRAVGSGETKVGLTLA